MGERFNSLTGEIESRRIVCVDNSNVFFTMGYHEQRLVHWLKRINTKRKKENKNRWSFKTFYLLYSAIVATILLAVVLSLVLMSFFLVLNPIIEWNYNNIYLVKYIEDSEEYKQTRSLKLEKKLQEQVKQELEVSAREIEIMNEEYKKRLETLEQVKQENKKLIEEDIEEQPKHQENKKSKPKENKKPVEDEELLLND